MMQLTIDRLLFFLSVMAAEREMGRIGDETKRISSERVDLKEKMSVYEVITCQSSG